MRTKIYVLHDEMHSVRYLGKTLRELRSRLAGHLYEARRGDKTHKGCWIRSMLAKGLVPSIEVLEEVDGDGSMEEIEHIKRLREIGVRLVNGTDGGDGNPNPSAETRKKMSDRKRGIPISEETKRKISLVTMGHLVSEETRKRLSDATKASSWIRGKHHSEGTLRKMSDIHKGQVAWNKGKVTSIEVRDKISRGCKGKAGRIKGFHHSDEFKAMMSEKLKGRKPWTTGRHLSEEHRSKIRAGNLGRIAWNKGKTISEETRQKISDGCKGWKLRRAS